MTTLAELVGLFRGDDDSLGYAHALLVMEICENLPRRPKRPEDVARALYGTSQIDSEIEEIIKDGYLRFAAIHSTR